MFSSKWRIKYYFKSAVAITLHFQLCSARYKVLQVKNSRKSVSATIQSPRKCDDSCALTIKYCLESAAATTLRFQLFLASYTVLQTKSSVRIVSAINLVIMEKTDNSHLQMYCREAMHRAIVESTPWAVSKKKWDTKDKGKSMMHALYVMRYAKRHISGQSDVKQ